LEVCVVTGKRLPRFALIPLVLIGVLPGCGPKRAPAVTTGASRPLPPPVRPAPESTMPEQPVDPGPDVQPMTDERTSAEDFSVSDASGEGGPLEDVQFEYDQARLSDQGRAIVERHALWLQNHRAAKVVVEGHCDERGTTDYNLALGEQRARVVRDYLVSLGVAADRLTTVSYGKERPLDTGSNEAAWARNRRAHFNVRR
jgi:peptidoglycan-associated lipoprotein